MLHGWSGDNVRGESDMLPCPRVKEMALWFPPVFGKHTQHPPQAQSTRGSAIQSRLTVYDSLSLPDARRFGTPWLVTSLLGLSQLHWKACLFSLAPQRCLPCTVCRQDPAVISHTPLIKSSEAVMYFHVFPLLFLPAWAFQIIDDTLVNHFPPLLFTRYLSLEGILFI